MEILRKKWETTTGNKEKQQKFLEWFDKRPPEKLEVKKEFENV